MLAVTVVPALTAQTPAPNGVPAGAARGPAMPMPQGEAEVRGTIVDDKGNALAGGSVAVRLKRDSSLVGGAMAGTDGKFRVAGLMPGAYALRITRVGFTPARREVTITDKAQRVNLEPIGMARAVVSLQSVQVTGAQDAMIVAPDRNGYRAKDVAPQAANASEVLEAVPSVQVDGEGKVSLRGNENVIVQVNGRPTPLKGAQLASFLKTLPGPVVERIEVIPNPSAKYDPEGMAGIINIVLKQDADLGLSGGYNLSLMNQDRANGSANLGWQEGAWTLFGSYGYNRDRRTVVGNTVRERYDASNTLLSVGDQNMNGSSANAGHNVTANIDFRPNKQDVLSNALVLNVRAANDAQQLAAQDYDGSQLLLAQQQRPRLSNSTGFMGDYTAAWKHTFELRKNELSSEVRINRTVDNDDVLLSNLSWNGLTLFNADRQRGESRATQLTMQSDWTRTFTPNTKLESGVRGNARWLERDLVQTLDATGTGVWTPGSLTNSFQFDEKVAAAYAVLSQSLGRFDVQGGLRGEYTRRDFALGSNSYPFNYFSLFPSAAVMVKFDDSFTSRISYSRRIRRPGTQELNPFPQFTDAQNAFLGNPNLRPEFTDAIELSLTKTGKLGMLQFSPFYRHTTDIVRWIVNSDTNVAGRQVSAVTFTNLATGNSFGADLNAQMNFGPMLSVLTGANVFRVVTDGGSQSGVGADAIGWRARLNLNLKLTQTFTTSVFGFYNAPMNIEGGRMGGSGMVVLAFRQKVQKDRGTISLRIQDPFNTMQMAVRSTTGTLVQMTDRKFGVRGVFLGYSWAMGQAPRFRPPPQQDQGQQAGFGAPP